MISLVRKSTPIVARYNLVKRWWTNRVINEDFPTLFKKIQENEMTRELTVKLYYIYTIYYIVTEPASSVNVPKFLETPAAVEVFHV